MNTKRNTSRLSLILALWLILATVSCGINTAPGSSQVTPTPTSWASEPLIKPTITTSLCSGLIGELEVQVLVGPAEAVGLEPFSVGSIPFSVVTVEAPYVVEGLGQLVYEDMLAEEWGSYSVYLVMDTTIKGECVDTGTGEEINLEVVMTGEQMVEVIADDFHGEYPWTGTHSLEFSVPLLEGASMEGEGWALTLHLPGK